MDFDVPSYLLGKNKGSGGTSDYSDLSNKPSINDVTLSGNKTSSDLGVQSEIDSSNKLSADLVDDTNTTNKFVSASDISAWNGKQDTIQYSTMPTASSTNLGQIVQYTGTTDSTYTNGYFYECVSDGGDPATYSWENINIQPASSGGTSIIYKNYGWSLYLNNDIQVGLYITKSSNQDLELYDLQNTSHRYSIPFGMFWVVKKYSECNVGDVFLVYQDVNTTIFQKANNTQGYNVYNNGTEWVKKSNILTRDNAESYTPTGNYNPSTKKYVDDKPTTYTGYDATKTQVLKNVNGTLTWVDE